jgi:TetR/AcrR family transcriptional regulator, transcriptional repressor for nem operon
MARPRLFDEDRAVDAAMRSFWAHGYEATSTEDLCAATGMGRGSVYNAFGGKRELFERALARYMDGKDTALEELMGGGLPIREKVRAVLWQAVDPPAGDPAGCLVVNTMVELAPRDPGVADALSRDYQRRWRALRDALAASRRAGEITKATHPDDLAHVVIAAITALRVMAGAGASRAALETVAAAALDAL